MMPQTRRNITAHELIGLKVEITNSTDPTLTGISGVVRDETKNTLILEAKGQLLTIPKENTEFLFELASGEEVAVPGSRIQYRPEDRVKRGLARW